MKKYFKLYFFFIFLWVIQTAGASPFVKDVTYQGTKLVKKYENKAMAEYIPQRESMNTWTELFAVRVIPNSISSEESIKRFTEHLTPPNPEQSSSSRVITSHSSSEKNVHFIVLIMTIKTS